MVQLMANCDYKQTQTANHVPALQGVGERVSVDRDLPASAVDVPTLWA